MSDTDLKEKEEQGVLDDMASQFSPEEQAAFGQLAENDSSSGNGQDTPLYTPDDETPKKKGRLTRRQKLIGGILFATLLGGGGGLIIISGPLQLIHLSQVLQRNFAGNENNSAHRAKGLFRYHRTGDVGETRVGRMASRSYAKTIAQLKNVGIELPRNPLTGHATATTIDISKHPEFKGMDRAQATKAIANKYGVAESTVNRIGTGADINSHKFAITMNDLNLKASESLQYTSVKTLNDGKVPTAMKMRPLKRFHNLPKLFSPLERAYKTRVNQLATAAARRQAAKERSQQRKPPQSSKIAEAKNNLKSKLAGHQGALSGALLATGAVCLVRSVADDVVTVNRAEIVTPATIEAIDKIAVGAQSSTGNARLEQMGPEVESFRDKDGRTIWESKPLQVTAGNPDPRGDDITDDFKQGFSNKTTASEIRSWLDIPGGGIACSGPGQIFQGVVGVGLIFLGPAGWAVNAAKGAASMAATGGVIYLLQKQFSKLIAEQPLVDLPAGGPLGGHILAYGGREAANIGGRMSGGIELTDAESNALDRQLLEQDRKDLAAKSFFARTFDIYDHRSLAAKTLQRVNTDGPQNITNIASGLVNFSGMASGFTSILTAKAFAAEEPYDWGTPRYEIPTDIIRDPRYEDPYDNADKVAQLLNSNGQNGVPDYIAKADKCFGVRISKGAEGWDAISEREVNPAEADYANANCSERSDNWKRVMLFVFDTRQMASHACYDGDDEACKAIDIGGSPASSGPAVLPDGTAQELARQILDSGRVTSSDRSQLEGIAAGQGPCPSVNNGQYTVDTELLRIIAALAANNTFTISSLHRGCTSSTVGSGTGSKHWHGKAVDIAGTINGASFGGSFSSYDETIQKFMNETASLLPQGCGLGLPNNRYIAGVRATSPVCTNIFLDTPATTKATGPHVHIGVP